MRAAQSVSIVMALSIAAVAAAGDFDGTVPLTCTVEKGHDCLPAEAACSAQGRNRHRAGLRHRFRQEGSPVAVPHSLAEGVEFNDEQGLARASGR